MTFRPFKVIQSRRSRDC